MEKKEYSPTPAELGELASLWNRSKAIFASALSKGLETQLAWTAKVFVRSHPDATPRAVYTWLKRNLEIVQGRAVSDTSIDAFQQAVINAVAKAAAHEGSVLGTGDDVDEILEAVIRLRHADRHDFAQRYAAASKALHDNWTRRVGTPGYHKPLWMAVDNALSRFAQAIATSVDYIGIAP